MKILAIDSSGIVASVAVMSDEKLLGEYTMNYKKTHSETLLPMLDALKQQLELDLNEIDAIAVAGGPGSFTGLRIGAATAKGLGLALEKPLISVPTVDAIAYNMCGTAELVCPIMDARRQQVYTGIYQFAQDPEQNQYQMNILREQCAISIDELLEDLNNRGQAVVFLGDGVPVFKQRVLETIKVPVTFAPNHMSQQRAGALAALALEYATQGKFVSAADFRPDYLRLSQAERERLEQGKPIE